MRTIPWRAALREAWDIAIAPQFWVALGLMTACAGVGYLAGFRDGVKRR